MSKSKLKKQRARCTTCNWLGNGECIDLEGCNKKSPIQLGLIFVKDELNDSGDK